jgi:hypothetical protein
MLCYVSYCKLQVVTSMLTCLLYISRFEYVFVFVWLRFLYRPNFSFCIVANVINFYMENKLFLKQVNYVQSLFTIR